MQQNDIKILLVDDDPDTLEFLSYNLKKDGFEIHTVHKGKDAVEIAQKIIPNLIILDIMMPEMDGIETCEKLREIDFLDNTIIIFLTARGEDYSQIAGFQAGGDDYIMKPIKPKVLISRINALLRRHRSGKVSTISNAGENVTLSNEKLIIDRNKYIIIKDGISIDMPKKEFELLALLASRPEKVFTREEIFSSVWEDKSIVGERTIDVHIRKLREKIGDDYIKTIKGVGYKFVDQE